MSYFSKRHTVESRELFSYFEKISGRSMFDTRTLYVLRWWEGRSCGLGKGYNPIVFHFDGPMYRGIS